MSQLNFLFSEHFRNQVLSEGPSNKTPTLICRCLQALAEALKINASVTTIDLGENQIGAEGAKAWCVVGSAEYSRMLRHVMMSRSRHPLTESLDGLEVL